MASRSQFFDPALLGVLLPSLVGGVGLAEEGDAAAFETLAHGICESFS